MSLSRFVAVVFVALLTTNVFAPETRAASARERALADVEAKGRAIDFAVASYIALPTEARYTVCLRAQLRSTKPLVQLKRYDPAQAQRFFDAFSKQQDAARAVHTLIIATRKYAPAAISTLRALARAQGLAEEQMQADKTLADAARRHGQDVARQAAADGQEPADAVAAGGAAAGAFYSRAYLRSLRNIVSRSGRVGEFEVPKTPGLSAEKSAKNVFETLTQGARRVEGTYKGELREIPSEAGKYEGDLIGIRSPAQAGSKTPDGVWTLDINIRGEAYLKVKFVTR